MHEDRRSICVDDDIYNESRHEIWRRARCGSKSISMTYQNPAASTAFLPWSWCSFSRFPKANAKLVAEQCLGSRMPGIAFDSPGVSA